MNYESKVKVHGSDSKGINKQFFYFEINYLAIVIYVILINSQISESAH